MVKPQPSVIASVKYIHTATIILDLLPSLCFLFIHILVWAACAHTKQLKSNKDCFLTEIFLVVFYKKFAYSIFKPYDVFLSGHAQ